MKQRRTAAILLVLALAVSLCACSSESISAFDYSLPADGASGANAVVSVSQVPIPAVPDVVPTQENGVISAAEWEEYYPEIVASMKATADNNPDDRAEYPEENPDIQILYDGMAFSFDYTEAIGHEYTLQDIAATTRPHKLANCLTCKTPDFTALVNNEGQSAYALTFDEVYPSMNENISCYNCHGNTPGTIVLTHDYAANAWNDELEAGTVMANDAACGQCHIEYYFDKETKAASVPYSNLSETHPDAILAYYNETGFVDYTNSNTGVGQIKVQHPEFETVTGEGSVHGSTYSCADCHMGVAYDESGNAYVNHEFTNPQDNEVLMTNTCGTCHGTVAKDLTTLISDIQTEITGRENEVSAILVELNQKLAEAVEAGVMSEEELDEIRALDRDAQFYWDFVYVENSEGCHNSSLSRYCLDKAEEIARQALDML